MLKCHMPTRIRGVDMKRGDHILSVAYLRPCHGKGLEKGYMEHVIIIFVTSCRMSLSTNCHGEFKKRLCRHIYFGPSCRIIHV